jgi:hypothetical protein
VRRTDLRRRHSRDPAPRPLAPAIADQLRVIYEDIQDVGSLLQATVTQIGTDVRCITVQPSQFDLVITSPPYLNGTNYCRNTKLELLAIGLIATEDDLASLRSTSITAGINNVSARRPPPTEIPAVEQVAQELDGVAYDPRIPKLVRSYFSDMKYAFRSIRFVTKDHGKFYLDIGDSKFCGVHVPTPELLQAIAAEEGWSLVSTEQLRGRRSYDGSDLTQVLIELIAS